MSDSDLEDITYSRTDTIAAVSDYYKFLTTMYMDDSQVVYPPTGGWPSIVNADPDVLKLLGKSDEVLTLLAHLPYIRCPGNWTSDADAAPMCLFADWPKLIEMLTKDPTAAEFIRVETEGDLGKLEVPHVIGLASGPYDNPIMVLDTEFGIIHWQECPFEILKEYGESSVPYEWDDNVDEKEAEWREEAAPWAIPDFFEILKDQFKKLDWIPISPRSVRGPGTLGLNEEAILARLRDIYRQQSWPDLAVYDKTTCLEAVDRALAESYPSNVCIRGRGRLMPDPSLSTNGAESTPAASS